MRANFPAAELSSTTRCSSHAAAPSANAHMHAYLKDRFIATLHQVPATILPSASTATAPPALPTPPSAAVPPLPTLPLLLLGPPGRLFPLCPLGEVLLPL